MSKLVAILLGCLSLLIVPATSAAPKHPSQAELNQDVKAAMQFWQHRNHKYWAKCKNKPPHVKFGPTQGYDGFTPSGPPCRTAYIRYGYAKSVGPVRLCDTVTHEVGHTLGLHHSYAHGNPRNIMYPQWSSQREEPKECAALYPGKPNR